jgi:nifR3 family TIM-barrel protein
MLAPMAGVTDAAFRIVCRELGGCGMMFTEMVSAKGLCNRDAASLRLASVTQNERPISIQLFGSDPCVVARAIELLNDSSADAFDINMGCPVPKITKNGEGSALMRDLPLAANIVREAVKVSSKPVSVKIRKGYCHNCVNAVEMAKALEEVGAAMITVHGRTRDQLYGGTADWGIIGDVKKAVSIPIIGNGDVRCAEDAGLMMAQTGCDGIMIGRAAQGRPWIFSQFLPEASDKQVTSDLKKNTIKRHFEYAISFRGEHMGVLEMRKHLAWYVKGMRGAASLKNEIFRLTSVKDIMKIIENL